VSEVVTKKMDANTKAMQEDLKKRATTKKRQK
jgi:hypothetical protein